MSYVQDKATEELYGYLCNWTHYFPDKFDTLHEEFLSTSCLRIMRFPVFASLKQVLKVTRFPKRVNDYTYENTLCVIAELPTNTIRPCDCPSVDEFLILHRLTGSHMVVLEPYNQVEIGFGNVPYKVKHIYV